jgi:lysophospholipase L1-like esterase
LEGLGQFVHNVRLKQPGELNFSKLNTALYAAILILSWTYVQVQDPRGKPSHIEYVKVVLVGDSTLAKVGGWGPGFCAHLKVDADCLDLAADGRSTKSFQDEGLWRRALDQGGQFYFIQFGHNDQKNQVMLHTDPETTFKANLRRYVRDVRDLGGTPVLVTPLTRRNFEDGKLIIDPLREYAAATREVAAEDHVPLIDLYQLSRTLIEPMTQEQADQYDAIGHLDAEAERATATTLDRTHLNALGKHTFGNIVAQASYEAVPALKPYIQLAPTPASTVSGDHH